MHSLRSFWNDEAGSVVSAELVTIGAVVAVGAVTGLQTVSNAVNDELKDVTRAIRSLDQSYSYRGFSGCNSMTAGSAFVDTSIDVAGDWPANPSGGIQPRPSVQSTNAVPDTAQFDSEFSEEPESRESAADGPITSADVKLGDQ
jgi:Flp pilus assembly pilin Flp